MAARWENSHTHGYEPSSGFRPPPPPEWPPGPSVPAPSPTADPYPMARFNTAPAGNGGMAVTPVGWDFSSPGVAEQVFNNQQGRLTGPGMAGPAVSDALRALAGPGAGENFWTSVRGGANDLSASERLASGPGLDPYYDRAREKALGALNDQFAARGGYGSSAATGRIGEVLTDLGAEQANREAEYARGVAGQADQARMARLAGFGNLANNAQQMMMARTGAGLDAAMGYDQLDLAKMNALMEGALAAQDARRTRGRDYMGDLLAQQAAAMGFFGSGMDRLFGVDQAMLDAQIAATLGITEEALAQARYNHESARADASVGIQAAGVAASAVP